MVTDDDVLVEDDLYILDRIREFLLHPEVASSPAAKTTLNIVDRKVRKLPLFARFCISHVSPETRRSEASYRYTSGVLPSSVDYSERHEQGQAQAT